MNNPDILFKKIWEDIDKSIKSLDTGENVDMASIDKQVREFCDLVTSLPASEAKSYQPKISEIVVYLNDLVEKLNNKKGEVSEEISTLNNHQRAHKAYGKVMLNSMKQES